MLAGGFGGLVDGHRVEQLDAERFGSGLDRPVAARLISDIKEAKCPLERANR
jgi:hypothetical protein